MKTLVSISDSYLYIDLLLFPHLLRVFSRYCKIAKSLETPFQIAFFALVAVAFAYPGGLGGLGGGHGGGDYATPIIQGHPVVTKVFEGPGLGYFTNYAPKIDGPLVGRGFGPHIYGGKNH